MNNERLTATHLVHRPTAQVLFDNQPFVVPVFQSVSFGLRGENIWEKSAAHYSYASTANPTNDALEQCLAQLQGREAAWLTTTGKSAMSQVLLALCAAGDHVILFREAYKSTRHFLERVLQRFGVAFSVLPIDDLVAIENAILPGKTRLLLLESPTNPMTRVADLGAYCALAKKHELLTVLDNSIAGLHNHGEFPIDLFVHSLSKYGTGVGDVMGGVVIGSEELVQRVRMGNIWNTDYMDASVAGTIVRGLHTYFLRLERQTRSALAIAAFLEAHPAVLRVLYPGLPSHPDYELAQKQMRDFGTILAFDLGGTAEDLRRFVEALGIFQVTAGTGYSQSIVSPAKLYYAKGFSEHVDGPSAIRDSTIRLSIGLEEDADLIGDLHQAFEQTY